MFSDIRSAFRQLLRRPGFLLLGTGALGIGLAAAILVFGVVNTLVLRPVPGTHSPTTLVEIGRDDDGDGFDSMSYPDFVDIREQVGTLEKVYAYEMAQAYVTPAEGSTPARAFSLLVSGDYFNALGARMAVGRGFAPSFDAAPGNHPEVVLSHGAAERWFGSVDAAMGRMLRMNGNRWQVIGVAAPEFQGHIGAVSPDVYVPLSMAAAMQMEEDRMRESRDSHWLMLGGRLAPGATLEQANAELGNLGRGIMERYANYREGTRFGAARLRPLPNRMQRMVVFMGIGLMLMCAAVLTLACSNLAGVLLARGEARASELAVRSAVGAGRGRLVRQLFAESLLVALAAGAFGLLLAFVARNVLEALPFPLPIPVDLGIVIDWRVVLFAFGSAVVVALAFGLLPALRVSRVSPVRAMGTNAAAVDSQGRPRNRSFALAIQAALTVTLLLVAAFTSLALQRAAEVDTGFRIDNVYAASIDMAPLGLEGEAAADEVQRLGERLQEIPGIEAASFASVVPLTMERMGFGVARLPGAPDSEMALDVNTVGADFFDVFGLPVLGRGIDARTRGEDPKLAVINERFAQQLFGGRGVIGREFEIGYGDDWERVQVRGIVPDGRYASLDDTERAFAFMPATQWRRSQFTLFVHSTLPGEALREIIATETNADMPDMPPLVVNRFADLAAFSVLPQKILGAAASALGFIALLLAATGLYGVLAFQVERRFREFGVRRALGASPVAIGHALLRRAFAWLAGGALVGVLLAELIVTGMSGMLFGVSGGNPLAIGATLLAFSLICALAVVLPLLRVLRLQPMDALRYE